MVRKFLIVVLAAWVGFGAVSARAEVTQDQVNATLRGDAAIWNGLFALALGDQIRNNCPTIDARTFRTTFFVLDLYNRARDHGFSRSQIRAFQVAPSTGEAMRAAVSAYLEQHGVRQDDPQTYCALGQAEIAAGSQAGELLIAR